MELIFSEMKDTGHCKILTSDNNSNLKMLIAIVSVKVSDPYILYI